MRVSSCMEYRSYDEPNIGCYCSVFCCDRWDFLSGDEEESIAEVV